MTTIKKAALHLKVTDIPSDLNLKGLPLLLDLPQVRRLFEKNLKDQSAEIVECKGIYVRYKPATNCIVTYKVRISHSVTGETSETMLYGKSFTSDDFTMANEKLQTHEWEEGPFLNPVMAILEANSIFYVFPNDSELQDLATISNSRKISRILYDIDDFLPRSDWRISDKRLKFEVVRYKPEKRAVVKITSRAVNLKDHSKKPFTVYLRTFCDDRGVWVFQTMRDLGLKLASNPNVTVPRALGYLDEKKYLLIEGLEGTPLNELMQASNRQGSIIRAAQALAVLHRLNGIKVFVRNTKNLMTDAGATGETVMHMVPELTDSIRSILTKLQELEIGDGQGENGFVHGDFHCGQLLIQDNTTAVLDFDRSFLGERMIDVGNFCANLYILGRQNRWNNTQELVDSYVLHYEKAVDLKLDRERLKLWTVYGLLLFSVYPFRSLEPDWKASVIETVKECERMLL